MLALVLLALVLYVRLASAISTTTIAEAIWHVYTRVAPSPNVKALRENRRKLVYVRSQRAAMNSKDEFAKWARLDREHQRLKTVIDGLEPSVRGQRAMLQTIVQLCKWSATTGVLLFVQWRWRHEAVFWLPPNSLPKILVWILACPVAPLGSVSTSTWITVASTTLDGFVQTARILLKAPSVFHTTKARSVPMR